ncbi:hypothetical protein BOTCAL_0388g00170 [Botryotinia calthae]|uniref:Uncharacterized protein n=1 Tax=Botryotinia calthae TaxID=38488 RepID=A0A4Y8CR07_9HELO|nr:hypothetical protein BOTCAL_0388g00170 [Botryotinia calthae]
MYMIKTPGQQDFAIRKPMTPSELRKKYRKAQEDAKRRQSQTESNNIPVVQEQNLNEAGKSLIKDGPITQDYEKDEFKSVKESKDTSDDNGGLNKSFSEFGIETKFEEKTPKEILTELTNNRDNPKLARYFLLDITPDTSWFESIPSKVNILLGKLTDGGQLRGGDKDLAIEHRNDILTTLIEAALELSSTILDTPEISRKLEAQQNGQNKDPRDAVTSAEPATDNLVDEKPILASTLCENYSNAVAPDQQVGDLEELTQDPRDGSRFFVYDPEPSPSLYYTIDLYERIYSLRLEKRSEDSKEKTVGMFTLFNTLCDILKS